MYMKNNCRTSVIASFIFSLLLSEILYAQTSGNLLGNADTSFETGFVGFGLAYSDIVPEIIQDGSDGQYSMQVLAGTWGTTRMLSLQPGQTYQLSLDVKTNNGTTGSVVVASLTGGDTWNVNASATLNITNQWQRYKLNFTHSASGPAYGFLRLVPQGTTNILIDAVRLSSVTGTPSTPLSYEMPFPIEASIRTPTSDTSIFSQAGNISIEIPTYGGTPDTVTLVVNDLLYENTYNVTLQQSSGIYSGSVELPVGMYQAHATISKNSQNMELYRTISVIDDRDMPDFSTVRIGANMPSITNINNKLAELAWLGNNGLSVLLPTSTFWKYVETTQGTFSFPQDFDDALSSANNTYSLPILMTISGGFALNASALPTWIDGEQSETGDWGWTTWIPQSETDLDSFGNYIEEMAEHHGENVEAFQIYGEPNGYMSPENYVPILQSACDAIKSIDSSIKVVGMCSTWDGRVNGLDFIDECLQQGAGDYLDVISIHPYVWPDSPEDSQIEQNFSNLLSLRDEYAPNAEIWATEWGYASAVLDPDRPITETSEVINPEGVLPVETAAFYARYVMIQLSSGIDRTYMMSNMTAPSMPARSSGMFMRDYDNTALPAYQSWYEVTRQLSDATYESSSTISMFTWNKVWSRERGDKLITIWLVHGYPISIDLTGGTFEARDIFGRVLEDTYLTLSDAPFYISGNSTDIATLMEKLKNPCNGTITGKNDASPAYPYSATTNRDSYSGTDLLTGLTPSVSGGIYSNTTGTPVNLTDGTGGTGWIFQNNGSTEPIDKAVILDYSLEISSSNTNACDIDINAIKMFTGDVNGRKFQNYDVLVRYKGETDVPTHPLFYNVRIPGSQYGDSESAYGDGQETILANANGAVLAQNVDMIRFVIYPAYDVNNTTAFGDPHTFSVKQSPRMHELDVFGTWSKELDSPDAKSDATPAYPYSATTNRDSYSSADLINGLTPSVSGGVYSNAVGTPANLTDGSGGTGWIFQTNPSTNIADKTINLDYSLDTSTNVHGYDINQIMVWSGETTARKFQNYDVFVRFIGEVGIPEHPIFLGTKIPSSAYGSSETSFDDGWESILKDGGLPIASGVDMIRFVFYPVTDPTLVNFGNPHTFDVKIGPRLHEIDVLGTATSNP